MAILTTTAAQVLSETYGSTTAGQAAGYQTPNAGGDSFPLVGSYVWFTLKTAGTGSTVTIDSVELSNFGQDTNVTVAMAATDERQCRAHQLLVHLGRRPDHQSEIHPLTCPLIFR